MVAVKRAQITRSRSPKCLHNGVGLARTRVNGGERQERRDYRWVKRLTPEVARHHQLRKIVYSQFESLPPSHLRSLLSVARSLAARHVFLSCRDAFHASRAGPNPCLPANSDPRVGSSRNPICRDTQQTTVLCRSVNAGSPAHLRLRSPCDGAHLRIRRGAARLALCCEPHRVCCDMPVGLLLVGRT